MADNVTIFGIRNCDTMKKARAWLDERGISYVFHDYKKDGIERARLDRWAEKAGWETLLNRAGTTFRKLPDSDKAAIDRERALSLMAEAPSLIKRPVLDIGGRLVIGFKPALYDQAFGRSKAESD